MEQDIAIEAIDECRRAVQEGLGIQCTFVDDDARLLVALTIMDVALYVGRLIR
jgi:hypothetical protein